MSEFPKVALHELAKLAPAERRQLLLRIDADLDPFLDGVKPIIAAVEREGDAALVRYAKLYDRADIAADGIALTRNGHVQVERDGALTISGRPVVDQGGAPIIAPPNTRVQIEANGAVFAGQNRIGQIGLFEINGAVDRVGPSLLAPHSQNDLSVSTDTVRIGQIETGNASPLEAAVQMVAAQRHFESSMQALQTYKRLDERAAEVGRTR